MTGSASNMTEGKAVDGREGAQTVQAYDFSHDGRYASLLEETYQKTMQARRRKLVVVMVVVVDSRDNDFLWWLLMSYCCLRHGALTSSDKQSLT